MASGASSSNSPSDRIRDAGKWLIGASAAVGAALIAGSQLSDIGSLPLCAPGSLTCARLPLAVLGATLALAGISYVMWRAVQLLLPVEVTPTELVGNWEKTQDWKLDNLTRDQKRLLDRMPEIRYFRTNPDQINNSQPREFLTARDQTWNEYEDAQKVLLELTAAVTGSATPPGVGTSGSDEGKAAHPVSGAGPGRWARLRSRLRRHAAAHSESPPAGPAAPAAVTDPQLAAAKATADAAFAEYERARDDVRVLVTMAQFQRLLASFNGILRQLLGATVVTAVGITVFAWASNPGSAAADLSGAKLVQANLSGADLSMVTLDGADLTGADLSGARLDGASLKGVTWSDTTCPDGTNSNAKQPQTCLGHLGR